MAEDNEELAPQAVGAPAAQSTPDGIVFVPCPQHTAANTTCVAPSYCERHGWLGGAPSE